jgi:hypothetical protein
MAHPEDPEGRYKFQIAAARRLLEQKVDWADKAEWEVIPESGGWKLYAWRIEHPHEKGPMRYVPWGYFLIELDLQDRPIHYKFGG